MSDLPGGVYVVQSTWREDEDHGVLHGIYSDRAAAIDAAKRITNDRDYGSVGYYPVLPDAGFEAYGVWLDGTESKFETA